MFAIEPIYKSTMNGNYVINIGRQLGSGGKEIGEKLAARLGIDFYDKELINLASEESGLCREFFEKADEKASQGIIGGLFGMRFPFISDGAFLSITRQVLILIPCLLILPRYFGQTGVWVSMPVSDLIASLISAGMLWWQFRLFRIHGRQAA